MGTVVTSADTWDFVYINALLEPDGNRLPERIAAAEHAINDRLEALGNHDTSEKVALVDALRALQALARKTRLFGC